MRTQDSGLPANVRIQPQAPQSLHVLLAESHRPQVVLELFLGGPGLQEPVHFPRGKLLQGGDFLGRRPAADAPAAHEPRELPHLILRFLDCLLQAFRPDRRRIGMQRPEQRGQRVAREYGHAD